MANCLQKSGHIEDSIGAYKTAVSLNSEYADAFYNMGNAYKEERTTK